MGRIKQGLDYFPLNTDFMHDRVVRRVMKREGDSAFAILLYTLSYIYSGEGYYIYTDDDFYDELSDQFFNTDNDGVRRVIRLMVEYGFFDTGLYERYGILTSADIQRQFLFITRRRRNQQHILPDYCLLSEEEVEPSAESVRSSNVSSISSPDDVAESPEIVTQTRDNVTQTGDMVTKSASIKRKERERKENILPNPPLGKGGDDEGGRNFGEGNRSVPINECESEDGVEPEEVSRKVGLEENAVTGRKSMKKKCELTQVDIDRIQAPSDGQPRNLAGLLENLRLYRIPPAEQYAILLKSNYRAIGGKVWSALGVIRGSGGKIKLPGHYLLSVLNK